MIARDAALTLTTKEFDKARNRPGRILKRTTLLGELKVTAAGPIPDVPWTATLRIPRRSLMAAMAELKRAGAGGR